MQEAPIAQGTVDRKVGLRRPTKAEIGRLQKLARLWRQEEENLRSHYGEAVKGTMRSARIKDREALLRVIDYVQAA